MTESDWRDHLIESSSEIQRLLSQTRRIAVLGMKTDAHSSQPAYFVPAYAAESGFEIVPVPVYYPEVREIMGRPVYRKLADIPGEIDMVNVFRRSHHIPPHIGDILAKKPKVVWFQSGIRNDAAAESLARAGIDVVQDRCLMVEIRRAGLPRL